jgi:DNA repair exonuclease SbcCD ATPase subunit
MEAIRIKNTTDLTLEGGPVTVIEGNTYAGEALISTLKPDEERYVSYAVDLGARVNAQRDKSTEQIYRVTIANGILTRHFKYRDTRTYGLQNLEDKAKTIIIEHPRQHAGWKLVDTPSPREETPNYYRFEVKLESKKERPARTELKVTEETTRRTEYRLVEGLGGNEIVFLLQQKLIDDKTRAFLEQITAVRSEIADLKRKLEDLQNEQKAIFDDQNRLRSNLQSLGQSEEERNLRSRIVKQLNQQEDRLETITKSIKDLQAQLTAKQEALSKLVMSYAFETR